MDADINSCLNKNDLGLDFSGDNAIAAEGIILLTDAYCASTCHTLSMLLKNDAHVKSSLSSLADLPTLGPM